MDDEGYRILAWVGMVFMALFFLSTCTDRIMDRPIGTTFGEAMFRESDY